MPTRQGWGTLLAAAASFAAGRVFALPELFILGTALVTTVVVALVTVRRPWPQLTASRILQPAAVSAGEPARVELRLANPSTHRSPRLRLWEPVGGRGGAPMQAAPLAGGDWVSATYRVPTAQRGILQVGPLRAEHTDALGLAARSIWIKGTEEITVLPQRVPLAFASVAARGGLGEHLRLKAHGRSSGEFHSQREYVPGDDPRRINWKTSARLDTLIVRETEQPGVLRCVVVLDLEADAYDTDGFERAVSAAASVVTSASLAGVSTRLVAPGIDARGPDIDHQAMPWLAAVAPLDGPAGVPDPTIAGHTSIDGLGLMVVVTAHAASPSVAMASDTCGPDDVLVVVTTNQSAHIGRAHSGVRFVVDCTSLAAFQHDWDLLVAGRASDTLSVDGSPPGDA